VWAGVLGVHDSEKGDVCMPEINEALDNEIKKSLVNGKIPCAVAFRIARDLKMSPKQVGDACNRLKIKISSCQLGCFP
jgi:hypothetical protein